MARILIFEDDALSMSLLTACLSKAGHQVQAMVDANAVEESIRGFKPDLVITDIMMPGITGGGVYQIIRQEFGPDLPVIVSSSTKLQIKAADDPLLAHCPKPLDSNRLLEVVQELASAADGPV